MLEAFLCVGIVLVTAIWTIECLDLSTSLATSSFLVKAVAIYLVTIRRLGAVLK